MNEMLTRYLQGAFQLSDDIISNMSDHFVMRNFESHSLILREGQVADFIGFITKGVVRTYEYDDNVNEITKFFFRENQFITNLDSYTNCVPSKFNIEAISPCTLLIIKKNDTVKLPEWDRIFNALVQETLMKKVAVQHELRTTSAKKKYENFLSNNEDIINRVPLQYIASFLGITPQSLSRIRRST